VRFLVDNALPPRLATLLRHAGHDAVHLCDYGIQSAPDEIVLARARDEDRVLVSADTDFAALLALHSGNRPSFVLFREPDLVRAEAYAERLIAAMSVLEPELEKGCVAVFRNGRVRVRTLPFSDS
jgi:predicted nuclease of predicted toxin-antitoxin system